MTKAERMDMKKNRVINGMKDILMSTKSRPTGAHIRKISSILFSMFIISNINASPSFADTISVQRGKAFAKANCSQCHSIDGFSKSRRAAAPPFRTLHERYPVETLEDALGEGLSTGHPRMPEFRLDPSQVGDFISFLKSLE
jgi:mono/diheme cytochrome c family protein